MNKEAAWLRELCGFFFCAARGNGAFSQESDEAKTCDRKRTKHCSAPALASFHRRRGTSRPSDGWWRINSPAGNPYCSPPTFPRNPPENALPPCMLTYPQGLPLHPQRPPRKPRLPKRWTSAQFRGIIFTRSPFSLLVTHGSSLRSKRA